MPAPSFLGFLCLLICAPLVAANAPCENFAATGLDAAAFASFHQDLKTALVSEDKDKIASMASYPLKAFLPKKKMLVKNATMLKNRYEFFFKKAWVDRVLASTPANTVCNAQGVGLAEGAIWISGVGDDGSKNPKIITINL